MSKADTPRRGLKQSEKRNAEDAEVIDGETGKPDPVPQAQELLGRDLSTIRHCRRAIANIIKAEVNGKVEHHRARGLVYMLQVLAGVIHDGELEERINQLEALADKRGNGEIPGQRLLPERTLN